MRSVEKSYVPIGRQHETHRLARSKAPFRRLERQEPIERLEWFDDGLGLAVPGQRKTNVNAPPAQDCREVKV